MVAATGGLANAAEFACLFQLQKIYASIWNAELPVSGNVGLA
jgi:hypothetical protein